MISRAPVWAYFTFALVAVVFGVMGAIGSAHVIAHVVWVVVTILGLASLVLGIRKRRSLAGTALR
jgi:uncharacterized membrane protein YtjA (UPF0391 family)